MFADDANIIGWICLNFVEDDIRTVQQNLNIISKWFKDWSMYSAGNSFQLLLN